MQQSNFVDDDADEEAECKVAECKATRMPAKKFFAHLHLVHDGKCESTNRLSFNLRHHAQRFIKPVTVDCIP